MKELGAVFIVGAILILAINILGYIAVTYGDTAFWVAFSISMILLGATLIFISNDED